MYIKLAQRPYMPEKVIQSILSVLYTFLPLHHYNLHPAQYNLPTEDRIKTHIQARRIGAMEIMCLLNRKPIIKLSSGGYLPAQFHA